MEKNLIKEKNEIILPRIIRMIIFFYLISLTTFESLDQGIIPTSVILECILNLTLFFQ